MVVKTMQSLHSDTSGEKSETESTVYILQSQTTVPINCLPYFPQRGSGRQLFEGNLSQKRGQLSQLSIRILTLPTVDKEQVLILLEGEGIKKNDFIQTSAEFANIFAFVTIDVKLEESMLDDPILIDCIYLFVALDWHTLAKTDYLVIFRHLFQKVRRIRSNTDGLILQSLLFPAGRLIKKHSHKIDDESVLLRASFRDIRLGCHCQERYYAFCLARVDIECKKGQHSKQKRGYCGSRMAFLDFVVFLPEEWIHLYDFNHQVVDDLVIAPQHLEAFTLKILLPRLLHQFVHVATILCQNIEGHQVIFKDQPEEVRTIVSHLLELADYHCQADKYNGFSLFNEGLLKDLFLRISKLDIVYFRTVGQHCLLSVDCQCGRQFKLTEGKRTEYIREQPVTLIILLNVKSSMDVIQLNWLGLLFDTLEVLYDFAIIGNWRYIYFFKISFDWKDCLRLFV